MNSYRDPSPAGWDFATLLARVAEVPGIRRVRFTTSHPRDFVKDIVDAIDANPVLCNHVHLPVQSGSNRVLAAMQRLYTRDEYMRRIDWMKNARRQYRHHHRHHRRLPRRDRRGFRGDARPAGRGASTIRCSASSTRRVPTPPRSRWTIRFPRRRRQRRLTILQEKQRAIQIRRNAELIGSVREVLVEGRNQALGQWIGRTSDNRTLNFTHPETNGTLRWSARTCPFA